MAEHRIFNPGVGGSNPPWPILNLNKKMPKGRLHETELKRRRKRREKIVKLRKKYLMAQTEEERRKIIEKALRVNPFITEEEFLRPIKEKLEKKKISNP